MSSHNGDPYDACMHAIESLKAAAIDGMEGADWDLFKMNEAIAIACQVFEASIARAVTAFDNPEAQQIQTKEPETFVVELLKTRKALSDYIAWHDSEMESAKAAGVNYSTVRRALNDYENEDATFDRLVEVMRFAHIAVSPKMNGKDGK